MQDRISRDRSDRAGDCIDVIGRDDLGAEPLNKSWAALGCEPPGEHPTLGDILGLATSAERRGGKRAWCDRELGVNDQICAALRRLDVQFKQALLIFVDIETF